MFEILVQHQFFGLFLTLAIFYAAQKLQQHYPRIILFNPVILSMFVIAALLYALHISYRQYMTGANWLNLLLGPATVALAIPLYKQLKILRHQALAIGVSIMAAAATAAIAAAALLQMLGGSTELQMTIMMKSVSTPITIGLADKLHIDSSLAVFMVFTTGTIGTLITAAVLKLFKITDDETVGLALGVTAHGLGTARAMQISERAGAFAALGMSLMGIISAILIPYVFLSIAVPMTVRRLYVPQSLGAGASITLDKDQVHYLVNVLRMGIGDAVALFNAESGEWNGMLEAGSQKSDIKVKLLAQTKSSLQPPASNLTLCFAPLKKTRTDFLVEKASELGVHILQPIITEHTNSERVKVERLQQIVIEAAEQCDRLDVPVVRAPLKLEKLLEAANNTTIFLAAERGDAQPIATAFQNTPPAANTVFIIGPEGGFSDAEFQLFDRYPNIVRLRLGPRLLRAETAALAVLSAYQSQMGDWKY